MDGVRVPINRPFVGDEEMKAVAEVLKEANLTSASFDGGKKVREFERALASYLKVKDVIAVGAEVVFADISMDNYCIDPEDVRAKITEKTKAIIPVDIFGNPSRIDEINEIAAPKGIAVIEDAAQSLGSMDQGSYTGSKALLGCFSFYPSKVITTGEGGAIATNDEELARKLRMIRNHGMVQGYDTTLLGLNMR